MKMVKVFHRRDCQASAGRTKWPADDGNKGVISEVLSRWGEHAPSLPMATPGRTSF